MMAALAVLVGGSLAGLMMQIRTDASDASVMRHQAAQALYNADGAIERLLKQVNDVQLCQEATYASDDGLLTAALTAVVPGQPQQGLLLTATAYDANGAALRTLTEQVRCDALDDPDPTWSDITVCKELKVTGSSQILAQSDEEQDGEGGEGHGHHGHHGDHDRGRHGHHGHGHGHHGHGGHDHYGYRDQLQASVWALGSGASVSVEGNSRIFGNLAVTGPGADEVKVTGSSVIDGNVTTTGEIKGSKWYQYITGTVLENQTPATTDADCTPFEPLQMIADARTQAGLQDANLGNYVARDWPAPAPFTDPNYFYIADKFQVKGSATQEFQGPGVYHLLVQGGEFKLEGAGRINLTNNASLRLYLTDEMKISGSGRFDNVASADQIRVISAGDKVEIEGSSDGVMMRIYAPNAEAEVTGSRTLEGSLWAYKAKATGNTRIIASAAGGSETEYSQMAPENWGIVF
ncbi:hypothetical protein MAIT1_01719 [Magnetofaba australis IT-1]|uniref:DUF7305 domain-containing protein n=2 Tax=Magnetofaba TaxID=1472292 RepID=A0A1Y2K179_9PROT|nr:hypothetical protein MAIT1_01719 [Magnetofaba australis IT-1]